MDLPEATRIARHHLGDTLHRCYCGGAHADVWCVEATYQGAYHLGCAPTPEAAAVAVATQLRAAGWVPSHARLEWRSVRWQHFLHFRLDNLDKQVAAASQFGDGSWRLYCRGDTPAVATREEAAAVIAAWHAAALPSLHLPPFPGDKP